MCGIAGIFDASNRPTVDQIKRMVDIQRHRGPDAAGFHVEGPIALGMRRLSIIDVSGGDQPMFNEDCSICVVFNGEIFNYLELRKPLQKQGHSFRTKSDTEVLLHLYEEFGTGMMQRLNGMFAFALWDKGTDTLLLARDRMGVKPLYYARVGARWLFASELKAILTHPGVDTTLDVDAVGDYLRLGYVPRDKTPYSGVHKLLPGHYLLITPRQADLQTWWDLRDQPIPDVHNRPNPLESEIESHFDDAVRLRMRSDVPIASFLSGGLDSSLVTITAQRESKIPIRSFTVGFKDSEFDESLYARAVARQSGTNHEELSVNSEAAIDNLPLLVWHCDEPMGDSSIVPNYLVSKFAAQHVKVCLSGLGGDELFGGYARYLNPGKGRIRRVFESVPIAARSLVPVVDPWHYYWAEELRLAGDPSAEWRSYLHRLQIFSPSGLDSIGYPSIGQAEETVEKIWNRYPGDDPISRRQFVDQHTYLPDDILALTDRMSMANSLEVRVPFMDYRLVRLAQRIPGERKQTAQDFKIILKQAIGQRCPPEILNRPKWGFDTPLSKWMRQPAIFALLQKLPKGLLVKQGLMRARGVKQLVETPESVSRFARRAWALLVLETWLRVRFRSSAPRESLTELMAGIA